MLEEFAKISGAGIDEVRVLLVVLLHIPASFVYRAIPTSHANANFTRKVFGALVGLISDFYLFGVAGMTLLITNVLSLYFVSQFCGDAKTTIKINFATFSFLCLINIWRLIVDYEGNTNNICLLAMLTVPKQIYFNWHVFNLLKEKKETVPSILDYCCYIFNYVGSIASPIYSYVEFQHFISQTHREEKVNVKAVLKKAGSGLLAMLIVILGFNYLNLDLLLTSKFLELNVFYQIAYLTVGGILVRTKYYIIWHFCEIPAIVVNVRTSESNYTTYIKAISSRVVELNNSPKARIEKWNMTIARWLKDCFYMPLIEHHKVGKNQSSLITFILSAFWHGFYPTYYISFFAINVLSITEKLMFHHPDLFKYFPSFFFRLQFDISGLLFKRYLWREWILVFKNVWMYYIWIFIVYYGAQALVSRKLRAEKAVSKPKSGATGTD